MMTYTKIQKKGIVAFLFLLPFLVGTGVDLYVPSLPAITHYFQVEPKLVRLSIAYYMLGYGIGQVFLGVLSDSWGRRKVLLISGVFYTTVSYLTVFSPSVAWFNGARFLQGIGLSGMAAVSRAVATDCFSGLELRKVMTFLAMSFASGPIVAPFIGAYLQHFFGWQANFYYFAVYGVLMLLYVYFLLPETHAARQAFELKRLLSIFLEVAKSRLFLACCLLASFVYGMIVMFSVVSPFLIQIGLGYSVIAYGRFALLLGFAYFFGTLANRFLLNYISSERLIFGGFFLASLACLVFLLLGLTIPMHIATLLLPVFAMFFFFGFVFSNIMSNCLSLFAHIGGTASAIFGSFLGLGVCFLSSVASSLRGTESQLPLALSYSVIFILSLPILWRVYRR